MDDRTRRWLLVALALLGWVALVALAVRQGRSLRDPDAGAGSWVLLVCWSLAAIACLYAAMVQLLRARHARPPRMPRPTPRHRA